MEDEEERRSKEEREKGRGKDGRYILLRQGEYSYTRAIISNGGGTRIPHRFKARDAFNVLTLNLSPTAETRLYPTIRRGKSRIEM